jgi:hypothetical protein
MDVGQCRLPLGVSDKRCDEAAAMIVAGLQATRG